MYNTDERDSLLIYDTFKKLPPITSRQRSLMERDPQFRRVIKIERVSTIIYRYLLIALGILGVFIISYLLYYYYMRFAHPELFTDIIK